MTTANVPSTRKPLNWKWILGSSLAVTLLLFFVDEGNYNFHGLLQAGNLVSLLFYVVGIFLGIWIMTLAVAKIRRSRTRDVLTVLGGSILGIAITVLFFYALHGFHWDF